MAQWQQSLLDVGETDPMPKATAAAKKVKTVKRDSDGKSYSRKIYEIALEDIVQKSNSRTEYNDQEMTELMTNMKARGLLQAIGVRKDGNKYEIIYGNRRFTAATKLGWKVIDAVLVASEGEEGKITDNAIENMQRKDVPLAEQGRMFAELIKMKLTAEQIAIRVGVNKRKVQSALNLFYEMPKAYRDKVVEGTAGRLKKDGKIPARTAFAAMGIAKHHRLVAEEKRELFDYAAKDNVPKEKLTIVASLLTGGTKITQAIKKADSTRIISLSVAMDKAQVEAIEKATGKKINQFLYNILAKDEALKITLVNSSR